MDFKDKVVLITGASSGIGRASAIQFAKKGANIILVSRSHEKLDQVAKDLKKFNVSTFVCVCDVSDKSQVKKMSEMVLEKYGTIDILVNNAGFAIYGSVSKLTIEEIESQMETNYFGMIYCIKNFLPAMIKKNLVILLMWHQLQGVSAYLVLPPIAPPNLQCWDFQKGLNTSLKEQELA